MSSLGHGIGLRTKHYPQVLDGSLRPDWFEVIAENFLSVAGSSLFISIQDLFPGTNFNSSATIEAIPTSGVTLLGFYGQALGPFGAGQNLRTELVTQ